MSRRALLVGLLLAGTAAHAGESRASRAEAMVARAEEVLEVALTPSEAACVRGEAPDGGVSTLNESVLDALSACKALAPPLGRRLKEGADELPIPSSKVRCIAREGAVRIERRGSFQEEAVAGAMSQALAACGAVSLTLQRTVPGFTLSRPEGRCVDGAVLRGLEGLDGAPRAVLLASLSECHVLGRYAAHGIGVEDPRVQACVASALDADPSLEATAIGEDPAAQSTMKDRATAARSACAGR